MERDSEDDPVIDMTAPGSDTDLADGSASQISYQDMLEEHLTDDVLDEGYSPPDREPRVDVPTPVEERRGQTLDQRLAEEAPDFDPGADDPDDEDDDDAGDRRDGGEEFAGLRRSGRLADADDGGRPGDDVLARDVGVAGGAASAEEAAVHLVDDGRDDR